MSAKRTGKARGTKTSDFGAPGRISHDSSSFYGSRLYASLPKQDEVEHIENPAPQAALDHVFCGSSQHMNQLPDNCVHLMVTSPPYNVGKQYDENLSLDEYLAFLGDVWKEVYRVLVPGGRACVNVANLGRRPYIPLHASIAAQMIEIGFLMRGEIIWEKGSSAGTSTAWGSWKSASNPTLRDTHEYILVFSKSSFGRQNGAGHENTITKEQFLEYTRSVWSFPAESAKRIGHPAPFPVELPYRLIQLYTYEGDLVLDPFMGSGQTGIAAVKAGRHFVGYDIDDKYCALAERRIRDDAARAHAVKLFDLPEPPALPKKSRRTPA